MTQGLRLMLWNFTSLVPISNRLKGSRADSSDIMGQEWGASAEFLWQCWMFFAAVQNEMQNGGVPSTVLQWIIGRQPMAVEFHDFFHPMQHRRNFPQIEKNFICRSVEGSLKITHLLAAVIGAKLRLSDKPERITYDKTLPRGLATPRGQGKGKGPAPREEDPAMQEKEPKARKR